MKRGDKAILRLKLGDIVICLEDYADLIKNRAYTISDIRGYFIYVGGDRFQVEGHNFILFRKANKTERLLYVKTE